MITPNRGGGGLVSHLKKSYSLSDLTGQHETDGIDETDIVITDPRLMRRKKSPHRVASTSSALYFAEVDVRHDKLHLRSTEDISSGYSSGELAPSKTREGLIRRGSIGSTRPRSTRVTRSTVLKKSAESEENDSSEYTSCETSVTVVSEEDFEMSERDKSESSSEEEFVDALPLVINSPVITFNDSATEPINQSTIDEHQPTKNVQQDHKKKSASTEKLKDVRAGKYNKRAAPAPPTKSNEKKSFPEEMQTIRATLVLKPGVVKPIGQGNSKSDIFINRSPKLKRAKSKHESPISRLMMLPRKFNFWHKDSSSSSHLEVNKMGDLLKRSSWHEGLSKAESFSLAGANLSKSDNNLNRSSFQLDSCSIYRDMKDEFSVRKLSTKELD